MTDDEVHQMRTLQTQKRVLVSMLRRATNFTDWSTRQPSYREASEHHAMFRRTLVALEDE